MNREEFHRSRWKSAIPGITFLALDVLLIISLFDDPPRSSRSPPGLIIFFGGLSVLGLSVMCGISAWLVVRPLRLILDSEGFAVIGPLRSGKKVRWSNVEDLFILQQSWSIEVIAYSLIPSARPIPYAPGVREKRGFDGTIPDGWPIPLVDLLATLKAWKAESSTPEPTAPSERFQPVPLTKDV